MPPLSPLLYGVVLPLVGAALLRLVLLRLRPQMDAAAGAAAVLAGFIAAQIALSGMPALPPDEASQWLTWLLPVAWLAALIAPRLKRRIAWPAGLLLLYGAQLLVLRPMVQWHWEGTLEAAAKVALFSLPGLPLLIFGNRFSTRIPAGRAPAVFLLVWLSLTAGALAASGSLLLGQLAGALAAALGVPTIIGDKRLALTPAVWFPVGLAANALLAMGVCYAELHPGAAAALAALPLVTLVPLPGTAAAGLPTPREQTA